MTTASFSLTWANSSPNKPSAVTNGSVAASTPGTLGTDFAEAETLFKEHVYHCEVADGCRLCRRLMAGVFLAKGQERLALAILDL